MSQFEVDYVVCAVVFGQQADMTPITKAAITRDHGVLQYYTLSLTMLTKGTLGVHLLS